jgi:hypothetical protein
MLLTAWIVASYFLDNTYTKTSLSGFHTPAYLVLTCLVTAACAYYFLPLHANNTDRKNRRKKWTVIYDFLWIAVALIGISAQGYRLIEADEKSNYSSLQAHFKNHVDLMSSRRIQYLSDLEKDNTRRTGDLLLIDELKSIVAGSINPLFDEKENFTSGTRKKSKDFSQKGEIAYERLRSDFDIYRNFLDSLSIQHKKYLYAIPVLVKLFGFLLISTALGLRLAKVFADIRDA